MLIDTIAYVVGTYWIFLLIALLIGVVTGWFAAAGTNEA